MTPTPQNDKLLCVRRCTEVSYRLSGNPYSLFAPFLSVIASVGVPVLHRIDFFCEVGKGCESTQNGSCVYGTYRAWCLTFFTK